MGDQMKREAYLTRDGRRAVIETSSKPGMSIFVVFGHIYGRPCHWTGDGNYRMDGKPDGMDLEYFLGEADE